MADGAAAAGSPIGLLTHHLDHDAAIGDFVAAFAALVTAHPGARWAHAEEIFGP